MSRDRLRPSKVLLFHIKTFMCKQLLLHHKNLYGVSDTPTVKDYDSHIFDMFVCVVRTYDSLAQQFDFNGCVNSITRVQNFFFVRIDSYRCLLLPNLRVSTAVNLKPNYDFLSHYILTYLCITRFCNRKIFKRNVSDKDASIY